MWAQSRRRHAGMRGHSARLQELLGTVCYHDSSAAWAAFCWYDLAAVLRVARIMPIICGLAAMRTPKCVLGGQHPLTFCRQYQIGQR